MDTLTTEPDPALVTWVVRLVAGDGEVVRVVTGGGVCGEAGGWMW